MPNHFQRPPDERLVIGITGHIGSGKTSIGHHLRSAYGFQYLRYSEVLSEWLANDAESKSNLQEIGWEVMDGGKQSELNRRLIAQIRSGVDVAVDGLRHPVDYENLRNSFLSSLHLLYIDSPARDRWERLKDHGRYTNLSSFEAADSHPVEQQIDLLRTSAEKVIRNEGSLQDLYTTLDEIVLNFRAEGHL